MSGAIPELGGFNLGDLPALELEKLWRRHLSERLPEHLPKSILARLLPLLSILGLERGTKRKSGCSQPGASSGY